MIFEDLEGQPMVICLKTVTHEIVVRLK